MSLPKPALLVLCLCIAAPAAAQDPGTDSPPDPRESARDDWRTRQREAELRDPREDWRDESWSSEAWRRTPLRDRGYERAGRSWRARQSFDVAPYRPPPGVRMHSWTFGQILPPALRQGYGLDRPGDFALPQPGPGQEWVRVASDALLVEGESGRVAKIAYGVFR